MFFSSFGSTSNPSAYPMQAFRLAYKIFNLIISMYVNNAPNSPIPMLASQFGIRIIALVNPPIANVPRPMLQMIAEYFISAVWYLLPYATVPNVWLPSSFFSLGCFFSIFCFYIYFIVKWPFCGSFLNMNSKNQSLLLPACWLLLILIFSKNVW